MKTEYRPLIGQIPFEETMQLFVTVQDDEIIVTSETGFRAAYCRRPNHPQLKVRRLKVRRRTETDVQGGPGVPPSDRKCPSSLSVIGIPAASALPNRPAKMSGAHAALLARS